MKARLLLLLVLAVVLALSVSVGASRADPNQGPCPDHYILFPAASAPDKDKTGNGLVCGKFVDKHANFTDDKLV